MRYRETDRDDRQNLLENTIFYVCDSLRLQSCGNLSWLISMKADIGQKSSRNHVHLLARKCTAGNGNSASFITSHQAAQVRTTAHSLASIGFHSLICTHIAALTCTTIHRHSRISPHADASPCTNCGFKRLDLSYPFGRRLYLCASSWRRPFLDPQSVSSLCTTPHR